MVGVTLLLTSMHPAGASAQSAVIEIEDEDEPAAPSPSTPPDATPPDATRSGAPASSPQSDAQSGEPVRAVEGGTAEPSALERELASLRARLEALESAAHEAGGEGAGDSDDTAARRSDLFQQIISGLSVTGYVQAQYDWSDLSEDELLQGGVVLNRNRFSIRRGRLRFAGDWEHFTLEIELDGSTTRGPFFGLRRTTVGVRLESPEAGRIPFVHVLAGLTEIPFGHEVRAGQRDWYFTERSTGSLAFFRGPLDVGVRALGGAGPFRYDLAVMGGTPLDDRAGQAFALDPTAEPDIAGRLGAETDPGGDLEIGGGVSFLWGTGFHPGHDATKGRLEWRDFNENGVLDTGEVVAVPGTAAEPSRTFQHWAVGADARFGVRTPLGWTRLLGEVAIAQNLDRSFFVADPIVTGFDVREISAYVAVVQDVMEWGVVGFRYDYYDPNSDAFDVQRGVSVPADSSIHTLSPMLGVRLLPQGSGFGVRAMFQYDVILDALARDPRGVPTDLRNDQLTVRVQGELR